MSVRIKVHGADELERDLREAQKELRKELKAITSKGALNIKKDWRKRWADLRGGHAKHLPSTIGYDLDVRHGGLVVDAEIGVERNRRQWGLGHLIEQDREYGNLHNAPNPAGKPALDEEAPRFEERLAAMAGRLLRESR